MKKSIVLLLTISILAISLTSCTRWDQHETSLTDYVELISWNEFGYSNYELDMPEYFLPSATFITDYDYIDGGFHMYEETVRFLRLRHDAPCTSLLWLKYDATLYYEAKKEMLTNITPYDDIEYIYGDYLFYKNTNFKDDHAALGESEWFTMAGYNDQSQILIFIGFFDCIGIDQMYYDDLQGNWVSFIDTYYGEYYDFSE